MNLSKHEVHRIPGFSYINCHVPRQHICFGQQQKKRRFHSFLFLVSLYSQILVNLYLPSSENRIVHDQLGGFVFGLFMLLTHQFLYMTKHLTDFIICICKSL